MQNLQNFIFGWHIRKCCQSYCIRFFHYTHADQSLEEVLAKCQAVLDSFQSMEDMSLENRMATLNENWEASRSAIFEAIVLSQNPCVELCDVCHKAPCLLRCDEWSGRRMCPKCDAIIHEEHPWQGSFDWQLFKAYTSYSTLYWMRMERWNRKVS